MNTGEGSILDIAVGVLVDGHGRLLIARRRANTPGAGCWGFPGGKREAGESMHACLTRELAEEIGVGVRASRPLIRFAHSLGARPVRLHVWRIDAWTGDAHGREGQRLAWVERSQLADFELLPATDAILHALFLPCRYAITPAWSAAADDTGWWRGLERTLASGIALLRLRDHDLGDAAYAALAARVVARAQAFGAQVLVDRDDALRRAVAAHGLHWPIARLAAHSESPLPRPGLCAVSAHSADDLDAAVRLGADFAVLSPVAATPSHPEAAALGWHGWSAARGDHGLPVYALGGLGEADIETAKARNAQGVAAIRGFWVSD